MRKTSSPRKRMRELLYRGPKTPKSSSSFGEEPPELREKLWVNEARLALTIDNLKTITLADGQTVPWPDDLVDYSAKAVRRLFDHFKLDPDRPLHWRWLVNLFAYAEFWEGPKRKAGAPKRTDERDLEAALAMLPSSSNAEAARKLAKKFAKGTSTSGLRRRIAKVRARKAGT